MKYLPYLFLLALMQFAFSGSAQNFNEVNYPVSAYGSDLDYAFLGGLVNPNMSNVDFNQDGAMDLLVFDRNGNRLYTFLHTGEEGVAAFQHAPQYESMFPENLHDWAIMVDYDGDGIEDLFAAPTAVSSNAISVWKGNITNGIWSFDLIRFTDDAEENVMYADYTAASGNIQRRSIYVGVNLDIPAITDMDGDGDIDILSFEDGGSYLWHYKNMSVENTGEPGILDFVVAEQCWGKVKEGDMDATLTLNADDDIGNTPCLLFTEVQAEGPVATERHSGSSVTAFDGDGDGDIDVVLGDIGSSQLIYLQNGGGSGLARIEEQVRNWPPSEGGVDQYIFATANFVDVNNDGNRDLVSTALTTSSGINIDHIWYYRNTNTDDAPIFELERKNFLVNETINIGRYTVPTFVDYNADGLMDIVVGNAGYRVDGSISTIGMHLFENVGTPSEPAFELVDDDYLGFSTLLEFSNRLAPAFGDMDSDGDLDLIVCDQSSGSLNADLYYFENSGGANQPMVFNGYQVEYMGIDPGTHLIPQIIDLNQDGLNDIVLGEDNPIGVGGVFRTMNYFQNIGTPTIPMFNNEETEAPNTDGLISFLDAPSRAVSPYFYQGEEGLLLFAGTQNGEIQVYHNYDADTQKFVLKDDNLGGINIGLFTKPAVYDIDGDGFLELLIGSQRGGMDFYNTTYSTAGLDTGVEDAVLVEAVLFPNPARGTFHIQSDENISNVTLIDVMGRQVKAWQNASDQYDIEGLQSGTYFVKLATADGRASIYKLIIGQ